MVTGVGSLSSVGIGADSHYRSLLEGKSGIETLPEWAEEYPCKVCMSEFFFFKFYINLGEGLNTSIRYRVLLHWWSTYVVYCIYVLLLFILSLPSSRYR